MHETHLIVRKSKQLLPQAIPIFNRPFLRQEVHNLIMSREEGVSVTPNGVGRVAILHNRGVSEDVLATTHNSATLQPVAR